MRNYNIISGSFLPQFIDMYVGVTTMSLALFSMVSYTRQAHTKIVTRFIEQPKPDPKPVTPEDREKLEEVFKQLEQYLENGKAYLDSDLTIAKLANGLNVAEHLISKAINIKAEMHFFDYINAYRVKHAQKLLADEMAVKQYTMEWLATQCGFNNKTSFNKAFKKFTGETPTTYRDRMIKNSSIS